MKTFLSCSFLRRSFESWENFEFGKPTSFIYFPGEVCGNFVRISFPLSRRTGCLLILPIFDCMPICHSIHIFNNKNNNFFDKLNLVVEFELIGFLRPSLRRKKKIKLFSRLYFPLKNGLRTWICTLRKNRVQKPIFKIN